MLGPRLSTHWYSSALFSFPVCIMAFHIPSEVQTSSMSVLTLQRSGERGQAAEPGHALPTARVPSRAAPSPHCATASDVSDTKGDTLSLALPQWQLSVQLHILGSL